MLKQRISNRARQVPGVISREVAEEATKLREKGVDVLTLKATPLVSLPEHILEEAREAVKMTIHPPPEGLLELRNAISEKLIRENQIEVDPKKEILVTNGAMQALYVTLTSLLDPGDEVLMLCPGFFYYGIVELVGAVGKYASLNEEKGFDFEAEELEKKITPRTKVIILNTPENPTGYVASMKDLKDIADMAERHDLVIISDESYEKLVYDGLKHYSIGSLSGMSSRVITIQSFTKSYAMPDWRMGFISANEEMLREFKKVHEWMVLWCNYFCQKVATAALTGPQNWIRQITKRFERRRDLVCEGIADVDGISCIKPKGCAFVFPNISKLGMPSRNLSSYLLKEYGIPTHPGVSFQGEGHIRIPFGATDETIKEFLKRFQEAVGKLHRSNRRK